MIIKKKLKSVHFVLFSQVFFSERVELSGQESVFVFFTFVSFSYLQCLHAKIYHYAHLSKQKQPICSSRYVFICNMHHISFIFF